VRRRLGLIGLIAGKGIREHGQPADHGKPFPKQLDALGRQFWLTQEHAGDVPAGLGEAPDISSCYRVMIDRHHDDRNRRRRLLGRAE